MQFEQQVEEKVRKKLVASTIIADRYEVIEKIGEGAMGVVYKARHTELGRTHAIKVLRTKIVDDSASRERFKREGKIAASLNHPNLTAIYDCGEMSDGFPFLVMDFVEGHSLDQMIKRFGCLSADVAVPLFIQMCKGLAHAHQKGIIHRDLKPGNVMIVSEGKNTSAKIMDFGIAKHTEAESNLTNTGEVFGSVFYMSPEQCAGQSLDARTDIYSLGCLMYETLAGKPPLRGENAVQTIYKHMNEKPKSFLEIGAAVPKDIEDIIFKAMEKDPARRFQSADEMAASLERLLGPSTPGLEANPQERTAVSAPLSTYQQTSIVGTKSKRGAVVTAIAALLLLGGIAIGFMTTQQRQPAAPQATSSPAPGPGTPTPTPEVTPKDAPTSIAPPQEQPWSYSQTRSGLQVRTNPAMAGQPEMIVIYSHQASNQGFSQDNDYLHIGNITVNVPERKSNCVLVLSGYAPQVWKLNVAKGTKIEKVILTGLHEQTVQGVPEGVKVLSSSERSAPVGDTPKDYYETKEAGEIPFPNQTLNLMSEENALDNSSFAEMRSTLKKLSGRDVSTLIYASKAPKEIDL